MFQAMSALLSCGSCFDTQNLSEDGNIYFWLDLLLTSPDDKVKLCYKFVTGCDKNLKKLKPSP